MAITAAKLSNQSGRIGFGKTFGHDKMSFRSASKMVAAD